MDDVKKALRFSPLVGVLGQRQVGKTTLIEELVGGSYETMDDEERLSFARARPQGYLANFQKLTAIDECQKAPELFSALKLRVQKDKRPGQFVLSGSVRFTSRKAIQESLTGRIFNLELLPMTLAESHHLPYFDYLHLFGKDFSKTLEVLKSRQSFIPENSVERYLSKGGLPGICFLREESHRRNKFKAHLETLLQRDLHLIIQTTAPFESLVRLLIYLADNQGQPFSLKECAQIARLSQNTIKKLLEAYEGLFLIRRVVGVGFRSGPTFYLEDQGMAYYLMTDKKKNYYSRFLFSQIFPNIHYSHPNKYQFGYFENKSGLKIDLVASLDEVDLGFVFENSEIPSHKLLKAAEAFMRENKKPSKVILLNAAKNGLKVGKDIVQLPVHWIA